MHYFSNLFDKVLYMVRTCPLFILRSIWILYTRNIIYHASPVGVCQQTPTELAASDWVVRCTTYDAQP